MMMMMMMTMIDDDDDDDDDCPTLARFAFPEIYNDED